MSRRPPVDIGIVLNHYIGAALWSSNDESDDAGGDPMDANYGAEDIDDDTRAAMRAECEAFVASVSDEDLETYADAAPGHVDAPTWEVQFGHDFWLTRAHHGVGFWDRAWLDKATGRRLTDLAHAAGERWLYVGDDGKVYQ